MKIRLIISAILFLGNASVTHLLWGVLVISTLPVCFLILSYFCTSLLIFNIRSPHLRALTYTLNVAVFLLGIAYAIYYRNPLGFYTSFTATVLFAKNFIAGPDRKDKTIAKVANTLVLSALSAALVITGIAFTAALRNPLENGAGVQWNEAAERKFYEVASGSTDEEKVQSAYTFITENFIYDNNYDCFYQHFDVDKTLRRKTGVCYDFACLFAAICRSQGIPCYVIDGYRRTDPLAQHAWNRVYYNGSWWDLDVTNDANPNNKTPYGFHKLDSYDSLSADYVITRIY